MFQEALYPRALSRLSPAAGRALEPGRSTPDLVQKDVTKNQSVHSIWNWTFLQYVGMICLWYISQEIHRACLVYLINKQKKQTSLAY